MSAPIIPAQIRFIDLRDQQIQLAGDAARRTFPTAAIVRYDRLENIPTSLARGDELWVAGEAAAAGITALVSSSDARRWNLPAVLVAGRDGSGAAVRAVDFAEMEVALLAEIFRATFVEHQLRRENSRWRGDMRTVATRIVHDLRSPLTPIFANCELLQMILADARIREDDILQGLNNSAEDLSGLIDRLSLLAKVTTVPRPLENVALGPVVFAVRQKLEGKTIRAGATIVEPPTWPQVRGASPWLELIFTQWMENSLRYAGPAPRIELGAEAREESVRIWIRDQGPGVPVEKVSRLFQPFDTLHELSATRGLGLPLVQRLAELQGGIVGYTPRAGGGTEFFIELPAAS